MNISVNVAQELFERQKLINHEIQNVAQNVAQKHKVNTQYLAEKLGVNRKTIQRELAELVEKHIVQWVGPDKLGYWEVINSPDDTH
jgi:predicted HTH transcriptional regulator